MSSPSPLISLRRDTVPRIGVADFIALKLFEEKHPELYERARRNAKNNVFNQMEAFNLVFHGAHKATLMRYIELAREDMMAGGRT